MRCARRSKVGGNNIEKLGGRWSLMTEEAAKLPQGGQNNRKGHAGGHFQSSSTNLHGSSTSSLLDVLNMTEDSLPLSHPFELPHWHHEP